MVTGFVSEQNSEPGAAEHSLGQPKGPWVPAGCSIGSFASVLSLLLVPPFENRFWQGQPLVGCQRVI